MTAISKAPNHPLIASDRIEGTLVRRPDGEKMGDCSDWETIITKSRGHCSSTTNHSMRMRVTFPTNNWLRPFCPIDCH
jgi:hypothetical protein